MQKTGLSNLASKMKILFLDNKIQTPYGSHRIYIENLMHWLSELGHSVSLNSTEYSHYDVIICDKSFPLKVFREIRKKTNALIGIANNTRNQIREYDFVISACQTEKTHVLKYNKNVVLFPLLEKLVGDKIHTDTDQVVLCYHGNLDHLEQMSPSLQKALESLSKKRKIKLKAIYNINLLRKWKYNRPNIEIEDVQWDFKTLPDEILSCDIGIVPNVASIYHFEKALFLSFQKLFHKERVGLDDDYLLRFKSTTNAGRAFVFHQMGLPVVSDLYPDAYHILQSHKCGYLAHDYHSWLYGLEQLCECPKHRQEVADNARKEFNRLYDPLYHAQNLIDDLSAIQRTN